MLNKPWTHGPVELIKFAWTQAQSSSDVGRKVGFIVLDHAVELMTKTYLNLPEEESEVGVPKEAREKIRGMKFDALLEMLRSYAGSRIADIDRNEIAWLHKRRNDLYHEWHGLIIDQKSFASYLDLAK